MSAPSVQGASVFVTGAAGLVGSAMVRTLVRDGARVIALIRDEHPQAELFRSGDSRRITLVRADLTDAQALERVLVQYDIDLVFHLAAQTQVRHAQSIPLITLESNVRGMYSLLDAIRRLDRSVKTVIASSDKAYGEAAQMPYTEEHPLDGRNLYDASKSAADILARSYAETYRMPLAIARCGNIYGPGDLNWERIVPGTMRSLLLGERPIIRSDGTLRRDYLHVDDAVSGYRALASHLLNGAPWQGEAFNFGHGEPVSVLNIVRVIQRALQRRDLVPDVRSVAEHEIDSQWLDSAKARSHLGWSPTIGLEEGIAATAPWYREVVTELGR